MRATTCGVLLVVGLVAVAASACSGSTSSVGPAGGSSSGGEGDGGSSGDGGGCQRSVGNPMSFCSLQRAKAGAPLTLEVRESCGSPGTKTRCEVEVQGRAVVLTLATEDCNPGAPRPAVCSVGAYACAVPALDAGRYSLRVKGPPPPPGSDAPERFLSGELVVEADGTQTACDLPDAPQGPPPAINPADFDQSCAVKEDCELVVSGNVCTACCSSAAIAKSALPAYNAAFADLYAKCELTGPQAPCSCVAARAVCNANKKCTYEM